MERSKQFMEIIDDTIVTSTYDAGSRLLRRDTNGSPCTYTYDFLGRRIARIAPEGRPTYSWDASDQLATVSLPTTEVVTYSYGIDHLRTARSSSRPDGILWCTGQQRL